MATHRAVALLDKPGANRTPRPAAELIAAFGIELPAAPSGRSRHGASVPAPRADEDSTAFAHPLIPAQPTPRSDWFAADWSAPTLEPADEACALEATRTTDDVRARVSALLSELQPAVEDDAPLAGAALFEGADRTPVVTADAPVAEAAADDDAVTAVDLHAIATDRDGTHRTSSAPAGLAGATGYFETERVRKGSRVGRIPHQGVVAAASATVLGATAAVVAATGGFTAHQATADLSNGVDQATQRIELAKPAADTPVVPLASNYDSAAKKVAEAADKHRADATQIIAAAHAPQRATNPARGNNSGGGGGAAIPSVAGSSKAASALRTAMTQMGKPYVWGASGPSAYDCSGLVMWAYKQIGVSLPHSSSAQSTMGTAVSKDQLQPGDLVFFYSPVSHVGIYAGNGMVLNASTSGQPVKMSKLSSMPFHNARRL